MWDELEGTDPETVPGDCAELFQQVYRELLEVEDANSVFEFDEKPSRISLHQKILTILEELRSNQSLLISRMDALDDPRLFHYYNGIIRGYDEAIESLHSSLLTNDDI